VGGRKRGGGLGVHEQTGGGEKSKAVFEKNRKETWELEGRVGWVREDFGFLETALSTKKEGGLFDFEKKRSSGGRRNGG